MPRNYVRSTNRNNWSARNLGAAITEVSQGTSIRQSALHFGIPERTLRRKLKVDHEEWKLPLGRAPVFTMEQETEMLQHITKLISLNYPLTSYDYRKIAYNYAEANNIPNDFNKQTKMAGKSWYHMFLTRHPQIQMKNPIKDIEEVDWDEERNRRSEPPTSSNNKEENNTKLKRISTKCDISEPSSSKNAKSKVKEEEQEQCLICGEFGKNGEIWYRCVSCALWSHSECSGWDSPKGYICDMCT